MTVVVAAGEVEEQPAIDWAEGVAEFAALLLEDEFWCQKAPRGSMELSASGDQARDVSQRTPCQADGRCARGESMSICESGGSRRTSSVGNTLEGLVVDEASSDLGERLSSSFTSRWVVDE